MFATSAAVFSVLLVITGVAKIARPHDVERALIGFGLPRIPYAGAAIGPIEVGVGALALFSPVGLVMQSGLYAVFAAWILAALHLDVPLASCGCLGRDDTPPSGGHLAVNLLAVGMSLPAVWSGPATWPSGLGAVATVVVLAVGVFLAYVVLTDGARLAGVRAR